MTSERENHPGPQVLVDLLEGTPVRAEWRNHLAGCVRCRAQVDHLRKTLALVEEADLEGPDEAYWSDLTVRVRQRLQAERAPAPRRRLWPVVAAAAAAVLAVTAWVGWYRTLSPAPRPSERVEAILPPIEEDAEFQFLMSIAQLAQGNEELVESLNFGTAQAVDVTELSPDERERLRQELERDLEAEDHAKS